MFKKNSILFIACLAFVNSAFALNNPAIDQLLAKQDYKEAIKQIGHTDDSETITYLRSRYMAWHPPIIAHFYEVRFIPFVSKLTENPNSSLSNDELVELTMAWARAYASFIIDSRDCKASSPKFRLQMENFSIASRPMLSGLNSYPEKRLRVSSEALLWAKRSESWPLRRPAVWLCGEDNVLPDSERYIERQKAFVELEQQIETLKKK